MTFPVIGQVERKSGDIFPLIEINMMSDECWQQLAVEGAVKHFWKWYGRKPETVYKALEAQRAFIRELEGGACLNEFSTCNRAISK